MPKIIWARAEKLPPLTGEGFIGTAGDDAYTLLLTDGTHRKALSHRVMSSALSDFLPGQSRCIER